MGLDIYLFEVTDEQSYDKGYHEINSTTAYDSLRPLVMKNNIDKIQLITNKGIDLSSYLKQLFRNFLKKEKLDNPFTDNQMNYLFGYDNHYSPPVPNKPELNMPMFSLFHINGASFATHDVFYFAFLHDLKTNSSLYAEYQDEFSYYPSDFWEFLEKINSKKSKEIELLNQFINKIPQLHLEHYIQNCNGGFSLLNLINEKSEEFQDWFTTHDIDFNNSNEVLFSIVILNEYDTYNSIVPFPTYEISEKVINVKELDYQRKGFADNSQYYKKYANPKYTYVVDNDTLDKIKQEFHEDSPIQSWVLNEENQFVYFSY